jgi:Flp pilus assembly protein TadD
VFSNNDNKFLAVACFVSITTILVYLPALQNGFVAWDDNLFVYKNSDIASISLKSLKWMFTTFHATLWLPLTWLSHAVDYAVWELNPMGHHLTSIIFHGLNTFLVVILVTHLTYSGKSSLNLIRANYAREQYSTLSSSEKNNPLYDTSIIAGAVTGLLFGLHPLNVETVAWVSERKNVLYSFFFLLSIFSYLKYTSVHLHDPADTRFFPFIAKSSAKTYYCLCLLFFILSIMSKPMAVTLPAVLIILDFYPLQRLKFKSEFRSNRKALIEKIPFFMLSIVTAVITVIANRSAMMEFDWHLLGKRILLALRSIFFYPVKLLWPANLAPLYPYPPDISIFNPEYSGALLLFLGITVFCIYIWRKHKVWLTVWSYYLVTLSPVVGVIQSGPQAAADRYIYMPGLGSMLMIGLLISFLWEKSVAKNREIIFKKVFVAVLSILIIVLSFITVKQIKVWHDSLTLWNHELRLYPDYPRAILQRGEAFFELGDFKNALAHYHKAIKLAPDLSFGYYDLGITYLMLGDYRNAILNFNKAIELDPDDKQSYNDRGLAYSLAIKEANRAIQSNPEYANAYFNRGFTYELLGDYSQASKDYQKTIELNPDDAEALLHSGNVYLKLGNNQLAVKDFQAAARLGNREAQDYLTSKGIAW